MAVGTSIAGASPTLVPQTGGTFGLDPAPGSSLQDGYFNLHLDSGGAIRQSVRVSNDTGRDADVSLSAVDATTAQQGGVAYGPTGSKPTADGAWITLDKTSVRLPAGTRQDIGFRVVVPPGARPGVHLAGIIAYSPDAQTSQSIQNDGGAGAAIYIENRRALAVQVTLPGPAEPELVVSGISTEVRPNGLNLLISIANEGNGLGKGKGHIKLSGTEPFEADFDIDTVVPRTSFVYPLVWTKSPVSGSYDADVVIDYGGRRAEKKTTLVVGAAEQSEIENRVVSSKPESPTPPNGISTFTVLLALAAVAAASVVGTATVLMVRRRSDGTPQA